MIFLVVKTVRIFKICIEVSDILQRIQFFFLLRFEINGTKYQLSKVNAQQKMLIPHLIFSYIVCVMKVISSLFFFFFLNVMFNYTIQKKTIIFTTKVLLLFINLKAENINDLFKNQLLDSNLSNQQLTSLKKTTLYV